jgi:hypothetical protein
MNVRKNKGRRRRRVPPGGARFSVRVRQVIRSFGGVPAMAAAIKRPASTVQGWFSGKSKPKALGMRAICLASGTRIEWLLMGRGDRYTLRERVNFLAYENHRRDCEVISCGRCPAPPSRNKQLLRWAEKQIASWVANGTGNGIG